MIDLDTYIAIIKKPAGQILADLTEAQQWAIASYFGGVHTCNRMPGTEIVDGYELADISIRSKSFDMDTVAALGLPWGWLGVWRYDPDQNLQIPVIPFQADVFLTFMSPTYVCDENENVVAVLDPVLHDTHSIFGADVPRRF